MFLYVYLPLLFLNNKQITKNPQFYRECPTYQRLYAEYICLSGNCDKWAVFSRYPVSPTSKTNRHDITEIVIRQTIEKTEITIINLQF